mgnify:CR=1 FL=1
MAGENGWQKQRVLGVFSEIDQNLSLGIISQMYGLAAESPERISLLINSSGGQMRHATALIEAMKACPVPIHTIGIGQVYSAALLILIAGKHRSAFRNTLFMGHQFNSGNPGDVAYHDGVGQRRAEDWTFAWMRSHYVAHTKVKRHVELERIFVGADYYFEENEALRLGVIDTIVDKFPLVQID